MKISDFSNAANGRQMMFGLIVRIVHHLHLRTQSHVDEASTRREENDTKRRDRESKNMTLMSTDSVFRGYDAELYMILSDLCIFIRHNARARL